MGAAAARDPGMSRKAKLISSIRANPKSVRFEDACRVARLLGFVYEGGKGSHKVYKRKGEAKQLNFQDRNGYIPLYQARQLLEMLDRYGDEVTE